MLRPGMCEAASRIFDHPLIFTNGTQGFIPINAQWIISLDGTREVHDSIRGAGAYDCAVENVRKAPRKPVVHTTITRQNRHNLEGMLDSLSSLPIKGVGFSFYTPHMNGDEGNLAVALSERDLILDELLSLRKKYWRIMGLTGIMADQFRQGGGLPIGLRRLFHVIKVTSFDTGSTRRVLQRVAGDAGAQDSDTVLDRLLELSEFYGSPTELPGRAVDLLRSVIYIIMTIRVFSRDCDKK